MTLDKFESVTENSDDLLISQLEEKLVKFGFTARRVALISQDRDLMDGTHAVVHSAMMDIGRFSTKRPILSGSYAEVIDCTCIACRCRGGRAVT